MYGLQFIYLPGISIGGFWHGKRSETASAFPLENHLFWPAISNTGTWCPVRHKSNLRDVSVKKTTNVNQMGIITSLITQAVDDDKFSESFNG